MIVYRLVQAAYKDDLSGSGASTYGGRWNSKGNALIYCSEHISLSLLELLVNVNQNVSPIIPVFHLVEIEIPDSQIISIRLRDLKRNWNEDVSYSRFIGDEFIKSNTHLILKVPSVVIPEEHNFIINPAHDDFGKVKRIRSYVYKIDGRLH